MFLDLDLDPDVLVGFDLPMNLRELVTHHLDILGTPKRYFFELLQFFVSEEREQERLQYFASKEGQVTYLMIPILP
jgi:sulfite reductase alpha subunit-like flavoprotein